MSSLRVAVWTTAAVLCLLNAVKPLIVDDPAFVAIAKQIAVAPGDPYGFELFWFQHPQPASEVLAPPVLPYWLALPVAAFGEHPVAWKLSLFPFALALCWSLGNLLRRFAPGLEVPLLWLSVISPTILPNLNLMLDVPAVALGTLALERFVWACDRQRAGAAAAAGLLGAVAMQTKYTGVTFVAAMLAYGALHRRWKPACAAGIAAAGGWLAWEGWAFSRYGSSQLLATAELIGVGGRAPLDTLVGLATLLGSAAPATALLALLALGARPLWLAVAAAVTSLPFLYIPALPAAELSADLLPRGGAKAAALLGVFALLGAASLALLGTAGVALARRVRDGAAFPLALLGIQLAGFPFLTPFLASRRLAGVGVAAVLALGHLASELHEQAAVRRRVRWIASFGACIGLLYAAADLSDALARREAVSAASERLAALSASVDETLERPPSVWFAGHWGFQYYAQRAGWRPLIPDESLLSRGDWLLVAHGVKRQRFVRDPSALQGVAVVETRSGLPWSTIPAAYLGGVSIRRQPRAQLRIQIFRVTRDFPAVTPVARPR